MIVVEVDAEGVGGVTARRRVIRGALAAVLESLDAGLQLAIDAARRVAAALLVAADGQQRERREQRGSDGAV